MELGFFHLVGLLAIFVWFIMWLDQIGKRKAMKNGCICDLSNPYVNMINHKCPYHFPINKIKRGQKWILGDDDHPLGGPIYYIVDRVSDNHVSHHVEEYPDLRYTDRFEDFLDSHRLVSE